MRGEKSKPMTPERKRQAELCCHDFYLAAMELYICCNEVAGTCIAPNKQLCFFGNEKKQWKGKRLDKQSGSGLFREKKEHKLARTTVSTDSLCTAKTSTA